MDTADIKQDGAQGLKQANDDFAAGLGEGSVQTIAERLQGQARMRVTLVRNLAKPRPQDWYLIENLEFNDSIRKRHIKEGAKAC